MIIKSSLHTISSSVNICELRGGKIARSISLCNEVTIDKSFLSSDFLYLRTEGRLTCFVSIRNNFNIN